MEMRLQTMIPLLAGVLMGWPTPLWAEGTWEKVTPEHCDKASAAGIKRCETTYRSKDEPNVVWKVIIYADRRKDVSEWEINIPRTAKTTLAPILMTAAGTAILSPDLQREKRLEFIMKLVVNAERQTSEFTTMGRYDWTSFRNDNDIVIRATRRRGA